MGIFSNIENALNTQLSTLANPPDFAWANTDYVPIVDTIFIRPTLLPATGALDTLSGSYCEKGLYQIDVFAPLNKGIQNVNNLLDEIQVLFASNKTLTANSQNVFVQDIVQGKSDRQDGWYMGSIVIHYICYT